MQRGKRTYIKTPRKTIYDKKVIVSVNGKMLEEFKQIAGRIYTPKIRELMEDYIAKYKRDEQEKAILIDKLHKIENKMDTIEIIDDNYFKSEQWHTLNDMHQSIEKRIKELL